MDKNYKSLAGIGCLCGKIMCGVTAIGYTIYYLGGIAYGAIYPELIEDITGQTRDSATVAMLSTAGYITLNGIEKRILQSQLIDEIEDLCKKYRTKATIIAKRLTRKRPHVKFAGKRPYIKNK